MTLFDRTRSLRPGDGWDDLTKAVSRFSGVVAAVALLSLAVHNLARAEAPLASAAVAPTIAVGNVQSSAQLRFTVIIPHTLFLGVGPGLMTAAQASRETGSPMAAHVLAVTVQGNQGAVVVTASPHDHQRPQTVATASLRNTPTPVDITVSPRRRGWTYSYANTVQVSAGPRSQPVVYTAFMP